MLMLSNIFFLGSGKSEFLMKLFSERLSVMTGPDFHRVCYLHGNTSPKTFEFIDRLKKLHPRLEAFKGLRKCATNPKHGHLLLLIDVLYPSVYNSKEMESLMLMDSRHLLVRQGTFTLHLS